jgi:1-acyl-sn-glycerol-3-phosphate acyltransferase
VVKLIRSSLQSLLLFPFIKSFVLLEIKNGELLETLKPPAIIVFNHTSHFDAPLLLSILPSRIRKSTATAAAADYFFTKPLSAFLVRVFLNAFPFARVEPIRPSLEYMGELLDSNYFVLIAPEGTRSTTGGLQTLKSGTGFMAIEMMVPIIPIKIDGLYQVLPKGKAIPKYKSVRVIVGEPLIFDRSFSYLDATKVLEEKLKSLKKLSHH